MQSHQLKIAPLYRAVVDGCSEMMFSDGSA